MRGTADVLDGLMVMTAFLPVLAGALVREGRGRPALATETAILLQHRTAGRVLLATVAALFVVSAGALAFWASTSDASLPARLCMGAPAVPILWLAVFVWWQRAVVVHADATGITVRDHRRTTRTLAWGDLHECKLSASLLGCRLRGRGAPTLAFPGYLPGIGQLLTFVRRHVPNSRWRRWRGDVQSFHEAQHRFDR